MASVERLESARTHYVGLDGLRGVAAIAVVAFHLPNPAMKGLLPLTHLAVDFFFVLSGFVIAHAYEGPLRAGAAAGGIGPAGFMLRRYLRLGPLYLLATGLGVIVVLATRPDFSRLALLASIAFGLVFLPVPHPRLSVDHRSNFPLDGPAWSLFWELMANLTYALLAKRLSNQVLGGVLLIGAAMLVVTKLHYVGLDTGASIENLPAGLGRVVWSFFAGVAVYRLSLRFPAPRTPTLLWAAALVGLLATSNFHYEVALPMLGFPLVVYAASGSRPQGAMLWVWAQLGAVSYGVYVLHKPILQLVEHSIDLSGWLASLSFIVGMVGLVWLLNRTLDVPLRRSLSRRLGFNRT